MRRELSQAWGDFLSQYPWDWFVTLTFREVLPSFRAHRLFRRFVRDIEKAAGLRITWFMVFEYGSLGGRLHLHALIMNVSHLSRFSWMEAWNVRAGYARILPFDASRGAGYYCAKYITKNASEWELEGPLGAYQPSLPVFGKTFRKSDPATDTVVPPKRQSLPEPDVRRRRSDRLSWHRRDWESAMLRTAGRWSPQERP